MSTLIIVPTKNVTYGETDGVLNDLIEAKAAYDTVDEKHLINQLTSDSKQEILTTIVAENFKMKYPHTIVLFDDAMSDKVWDQYINLTKRQALIVQYSNDGTKIKIHNS
ncbi:MAG: hypothetical protein EZS28_012558 [Streblomastix strix]|uniref:Uncharacterized protein n=1 Tax=Streblomastix strix TaxID=222440 RepID=A0A5J4WAI4_9EUKA|nr:MAG: hypothetical protein EZS28_012558 [Streblomastix strix]